MKIKAAVVHKKNTPFVLEEVELATPSHGEVLVRVVASGVCHTDEAARTGEFPVPLPAVLGHEGSGVVELVGPGVYDLKVGDHVAFSYAYCGHCNPCSNGHAWSCDNFAVLNAGGAMEDGRHVLSQNGHNVSNFFGQSSFATHTVINQNNAVKIDRDINLELVGPLGCGIQTGSGAVLNSIKPEIGSSIVIFGMGSVGMSALMAAKVAHCGTIIAVGGNPKSLELALELGATHIINRKNTINIPDEIKMITNQKGVSAAIDTTGVTSIITDAILSLAENGQMVLLAIGGKVDIDANVLLYNRTVKGVIEGAAVPKLFIPELISLYKKGIFPFDKLITFYDFKDINQAFEDSAKGIVIKPVLRISSI